MAVGLRDMDWRSLGRLVLSHHPRCHPFRHDVYRVGGLSLCVGCFTAYPIALVVFGALLWWHPGPWQGWLAAGLVVGSLQFFSVAGWATTRRRKIATKVALGLGLALTAYGILAAPWSAGWTLAALVVGALGAGVASVPRGLRMRKTCEGCFFRGDWERCVGMHLLRVSP